MENVQSPLFWSAGAERSGDPALAHLTKPPPPFAGQRSADLPATIGPTPVNSCPENHSAACRAEACKAKGGPSLTLCRRTPYSELSLGGFFRLKPVSSSQLTLASRENKCAPRW